MSFLKILTIFTNVTLHADKIQILKKPHTQIEI